MGASQGSTHNRKLNDLQFLPTHNFWLELTPKSFSIAHYDLSKNFFWYGGPKDLVLPHELYDLGEINLSQYISSKVK